MFRKIFTISLLIIVVIEIHKVESAKLPPNCLMIDHIGHCVNPPKNVEYHIKRLGNNCHAVDHCGRCVKPARQKKIIKQPVPPTRITKTLKPTTPKPWYKLPWFTPRSYCY